MNFTYSSDDNIFEKPSTDELIDAAMDPFGNAWRAYVREMGYADILNMTANEAVVSRVEWELDYIHSLMKNEKTLQLEMLGSIIRPGETKGYAGTLLKILSDKVTKK